MTELSKTTHTHHRSSPTATSGCMQRNRIIEAPGSVWRGQNPSEAGL